MDQATRLIVFQAQTENVKEINKAIVQINRAINNALRCGDNVTTEVLTKTLVLVFCAWVEANFSKVIHTPYGFSLDEIQQIKKNYRENGLESGWKKCIELGIQKISGRRNSNYKPNIRQKLNRHILHCVVEPSLIRNKIAHGQWKVALNRENTTTNTELTNELASLDIIIISKWFKIHKYLSQIVEALVESPNRAFHRDYLVEITKLEEYLEASKKWSVKQKIFLLKQKLTPKAEFIPKR